jgi:hypothetical protein
MRIFVVLPVVVLLASCVAVPQSRDEMITEVKSHPNAAIADTYTSNRGYEEVVANVWRKWKECYNVTKTTTLSENGMMTSSSSDSYYPEIKKVSSSRTELTLRMATNGSTPDGGVYLIALNIERAPRNKTKLTWYSYNASAKSWGRNKQWSSGQNVPCRD